MILELVQVICEADDLIDKTKIEKDFIKEIYQDLSSMNQVIEATINSTNISSRPK